MRRDYADEAKETIEYWLSYTQTNGECKEWTRAYNSDGYPRAVFRGNFNGKVHRIVYELSNPTENIQGKVVRHTCDNPRCINPNHLLAGTPGDNARDRDTRERHTLAAFKAKEIKAIRSLYATGEYSQKELASLFNVNSRTIQQIVRNKSYRWVK